MEVLVKEWGGHGGEGDYERKALGEKVERMEEAYEKGESEEGQKLWRKFLQNLPIHSISFVARNTINSSLNQYAPELHTLKPPSKSRMPFVLVNRQDDQRQSNRQDDQRHSNIQPLTEESLQRGDFVRRFDQLFSGQDDQRQSNRQDDQRQSNIQPLTEDPLQRGDFVRRFDQLFSGQDDQRHSNIQPLTEKSLQRGDFARRFDHLNNIATQKESSIRLAINLTPTFIEPINRPLLRAVRSIRGHCYLPELGDDDISDLLMELDLLVTNWGDYGGQSLDDLDRLSRKMDEIFRSDALQTLLAEISREGRTGGVEAWVMRGYWGRWARER
ncbi:hypothetical protein G7Y79_00055g089830 [Physcia stellaris]|nr:hypothetical protein G7Y79_00055g089830 [Physcia stellaris]